MSLQPRPVNFDEMWGKLEPTVQGVIKLGNVPKSDWNEGFGHVYALCVAQPDILADPLYDKTQLFLENHVRELLQNVKQYQGVDLLKAYNEYWNTYKEGCQYLHLLYMYLNTQHIRKSKLGDAELRFVDSAMQQVEQMEIGELGLSVWKDEMIMPLMKEIVGLLLEGIQQDRDGSASYQMTAIMQGVINSFVCVEEYKQKMQQELYEEIFEKPFLEASGDYYRKEASRMLQEYDIAEYMERVIQKLEEEIKRSNRYLYKTSFEKVRSKFEEHFVENHKDRLLSECPGMVEGERKKELGNLYILLKPLPQHMNHLINALQEHIQKKGLESISNLGGENIHSQFVENMLGVHKKYRDLIREVFKDDQNYVGALDKACTLVINHKSNPRSACKSPEMLAKHCDSLLRKTAKGISESEVEEKLGQSITIFKYIDDKDVFQKFYSRMLAKRLIQQMSQSMDLEEGMINRLKQACGYEFTSKLHRMFTDINVSSDLNAQFNDSLQKDGYELGIGFSVNVLQTAAWPISNINSTPITLPSELENAVQKFENFYHTRFSGRKLTWIHNLCQCELRFNYLKKTYFITMNTYQMAILLLFAKTDKLNYSDIKETLSIPEEALNKHIASLVECKFLSSDTEAIASESQLSLNMSYSNKRTKFKISGAIQRELPQESEQTISAVDDDRKMYLQAAIVRIMKSRKSLRHNDLITQVLAQNNGTFTPSISMIKKSIESLIEKQYLERTANTTDFYSYIA
ncbi:cullin-2 [Neocloeon triangulifer]|uniref:cullin-2 n=1 Tax=Neocloeon triangulifer TaxID=2078957 RepID=UPI00286F745D|nr:cullin-2 [Neocloeon triangulifer]